MFVRSLCLFAAAACVVATACGGDDDDAPASGGAGGTSAAGKGGSAGKSGSAGKGGSAGEATAGVAGEAVGGGGGGAEESALVARGDYLVNHVAACPDCHTPRTEMGAPDLAKYMSGAECFVKLPNDDCLNSRNLTNDETGLKNRTDEEIKTMIRDGIRPTATKDEPLSPVMPYYVFHNMTDADLDAVVAFLRTIPAVKHAVPPSAEAFAVPEPAHPLDVDAIPMPDSDFPELASAMRGRYLATQAGVCMECHTQHVMGSLDVLDADKFFAGGEAFEIELPVTPISANITSDSETGIGDWKADAIVKVLLEGIDDEGKGICPPMPVGPMGAFGGLKAADALDIANYIKSLPPIENAVDDQCSFP